MGKFTIGVETKPNNRAVMTITTRDGCAFNFEYDADGLSNLLFGSIKKIGARPQSEREMTGKDEEPQKVD